MMIFQLYGAEEDGFIKGFVVGNLKPDKLFRKMYLEMDTFFILYSVKSLTGIQY